MATLTLTADALCGRLSRVSNAVPSRPLMSSSCRLHHSPALLACQAPSTSANPAQRLVAHAVADAKGKPAAKKPAQEALVEEVMISDPIVFKSDTPIRDAVRVMLEQNISGAPVVDGEGHLVGVLSESDVIWKGAGAPQDHFVVPPVYIGLIDAYVFLRDNKQMEQEVHKILAKTVGEAMTTPVVSISPEAQLGDAASMMLQHKVNRLPVVNKEKKVVGVITRHDVLRGLYISSPLL